MKLAKGSWGKRWKICGGNMASLRGTWKGETRTGPRKSEKTANEGNQGVSGSRSRNDRSYPTVAKFTRVARTLTAGGALGHVGQVPRGPTNTLTVTTYYTGHWHWYRAQSWQSIPSTLPLPHQPRRGASHFGGAGARGQSALSAIGEATGVGGGGHVPKVGTHSASLWDPSYRICSHYHLRKFLPNERP